MKLNEESLIPLTEAWPTETAWPIKAKVQRFSKSIQIKHQMVCPSHVLRAIKPLTDLSVSAMFSKTTQARQNMVCLNDGPTCHCPADWSRCMTDPGLGIPGGIWWASVMCHRAIATDWYEFSQCCVISKSEVLRQYGGFSRWTSCHRSLEDCMIKTGLPC